MAVICYGSVIGWVVAIVLHQKHRSSLGGFHLRQSLGLYIAAILVGWLPMIGTLLLWILVGFWVLALISAVKGEQAPVPLLGHWFQALLSSLK